MRNENPRTSVSRLITPDGTLFIISTLDLFPIEVPLIANDFIPSTLYRAHVIQLNSLLALFYFNRIDLLNLLNFLFVFTLLLASIFIFFTFLNFNFTLLFFTVVIIFILIFIPLYSRRRLTRLKLDLQVSIHSLVLEWNKRDPVHIHFRFIDDKLHILVYDHVLDLGNVSSRNSVQSVSTLIEIE